MNLSPDWVGVFKRYDIEAVHWSTIGKPDAKDTVIMEWARNNNYIVFTHDLDFGTLLAATQANTPLVVRQANFAGLNSRIKPFKFISGIRSFKAPVYSCAFFIASFLPSSNFRF
ncbi:DUF5615 family PIN-like protein [Mastigocoleus testarum]|uniref:DUF5615 family PIN-like protein n=1 Tax=Mastigocoleus testarum TaxID=996925 RepID=UPI001F42FBDC|nr:DUF5615 family PIN-like protein [Mastigocoleus testarum]